MLTIAIIVALLSAGVSSDSSNEALLKLQEIALRLQVEAQTHQLKSDGSTRGSNLPEVGLSIEELIAYYGYPAETHEVVTEDGYILTLHRIPHGLNNADVPNKPAVLLMPGLVCNAAFFLVSGQKASLGYWLADRGYDVWLANYRGSTHSRRHLTLDPDNDKSSFWDYSFDEMGYYDTPAFIDYILATTNQEKLYYIGHSQGTTSFFAMASQRPEYNQKVRLMIALAPVVYLSNSQHPLIKVLAENLDVLKVVISTIKWYELVPHWNFLTKLGDELCSDGTSTQEFCVSVIETMAGLNEKEMNKTLIPLLTSHIPSGAAVKQLFHYSQEFLSGHFRKYDYGLIGNLAKYGKIAPPDYEIEKVTTPIALYYSQNDLFAHLEDISQLLEKLPNVVQTHIVDDEEFAHLDFGLGIHADTLVYEKFFDVINKY